MRALLFCLLLVPAIAFADVTDTRAKSAQTGTNVATLGCVSDTSSKIICPDDLDHTYAYNGSNQLITDSATDGTHTWVKTYTYSGTQLLTETGWVHQ